MSFERPQMNQCLKFCVVWLTLPGVVAIADDWPRFRGPAGSGVANDSDSLPIAWSPAAYLGWKTPLPGPGASSPIIVDGKVFVTCYSGCGLTRERRDDIQNLMRHLVCIDLKSGEVIWQRDVKGSLPEDSYYETGVSSHGTGPNPQPHPEDALQSTPRSGASPSASHERTRTGATGASTAS